MTEGTETRNVLATTEEQYITETEGLWQEENNNEPKVAEKSRNNRPDETDRWNTHFNALLKFKEENGHCLVPHNYKDRAGLARWVKRQRYQYKLYQRGKPAFTNPERVCMLEDVGFVWDSHKVNWQKSFQDLIDFKREYGHVDVPTKFPRNQSLATWVNRQRGQYKLYRDGKQSSIDMHRFESLESLGFRWEIRNLKKNTEERKKKSPIANLKKQAPKYESSQKQIDPIKGLPITENDYNFFMGVLCDLTDDNEEDDIAHAVGLSPELGSVEDGGPQADNCFSESAPTTTKVQTQGILQDIISQLTDSDDEEEDDDSLKNTMFNMDVAVADSFY